MPETASARFRRVYHGLSLLEPYDIKGKDKERIGRSGDGGYVLLKQQTPDVLYSFGVGPEITFEHILAERGTICYMFDHTIEAPPYTHDNFRYYREGVGAFDSAEGPIGTIDGFMRRHGDEGKNDILLKIDVEGAEYEIFDLIDESVLGRFTQIALEIHWLRNLTDPAFLERFIRMFEKLNKQFTLYHVHANNCAPLLFVEGQPVADVLELSYVRTDLVERKASETFYPTYLDCPNEPERVDIPLLFFPFYPTGQQQEAGGRNSALESAVASVEVDNWLKTSTTLSHHDRRHLLFARKLTPHSP